MCHFQVLSVLLFLTLVIAASPIFLALSRSCRLDFLLNISVFEKTRNVPCDDTSACPDDSTCCKTTTGKWACCPLPEAVCCDDHVHCCPHGTKCNPAGTSCDNSTSSIPWLEKLPPINRQSAKGQNVPCDDTSACPDDTTCCKTTTGKWGCCPMPEVKIILCD
uniref:Granulins domain-containing protein n=1 Tax=Paramormyrops kingsleyae TaxID=1676925 RepID=A0A3B3QZJ2_9TELE